MISTTADTLITASTVCVRPLALTPMLLMMATAPITTRATSWRAPIAQWIACPVTCRFIREPIPAEVHQRPEECRERRRYRRLSRCHRRSRASSRTGMRRRGRRRREETRTRRRLGQHGSELRVRQRACKREESRCDRRPQRERRRPNELRDDRALEEHAGANDNAHNQPRRVDGAETADELGRTGGGQGARLDVRRSTFGAGRSTFRRKR